MQSRQNCGIWNTISQNLQLLKTQNLQKLSKKPGNHPANYLKIQSLRLAQTPANMEYAHQKGHDLQTHPRAV